MKSKANQFIKVRAEMRRTFFYSVLLSSPCLMIRTRPTIKQHQERPDPTTPTGREAHRLTFSPSQHPPTATPSTASGRAMGAPSPPSGWLHALSCAPSMPAGHPRPVWVWLPHIALSSSCLRVEEGSSARRLPFLGRGLFKISIRSNR